MKQSDLDEKTEQLLTEFSIPVLQEWVGLLPKGKGNMPTAANYLTIILGYLSQHQELPTDQFYESLELIRSPLLLTVKTLTLLYIEDDFDVTIESEPLIKSSLSLLNMNVTAYSIVASKAGETTEKELRAKAIHRALASQLYLQITYYQLHLAVPEKEWLKIHKLFQLSVVNGDINYSLTDKDILTGKTHTIMQLYTIALLLGCSRINHLTPKQIISVCQSLQEWVELVGISKQPEIANENQIVIDVTSGSAPHFMKVHQDTENSKLFFLQIGKLLSRLNALLPKEDEDSDKLDPSKGFINSQLVAHLQSAWSKYIYREERIETDESIRACIGLENIHYFLCGRKQLKEFVGSKVVLSIVYEDDEDVSTIESQRSGDIWSAFTSEPEGELVTGDIPKQFNFQRHFDEDDSEETDNNSSHQVRMADKSVGGCCLEWPDAVGRTLKVGAIIGIQTNDDKHWSIGEVVWIDHRESITRTGVKLISTEAFPVAVSIPLRLGKGENYSLGILLPPEEKINADVAFLAETIGYKKDEYLDISQKGVEEKIKLGKVTKKNEYYALFECQFLLAEDSPAL